MREWVKRQYEKTNQFYKRVSFLYLHRFILFIRYRVEVKGDECLDPKKGGVNSSILFLSNHTSHIDGTILGIEILKRKVPLSIWALDLTFKLPYLKWAARHQESVHVLKVPNINEKRSEKHSSQLHKLVTRTGDGLRQGKNFLIFPSGRCKKTPIEKIEGKSAIPLIVQQYPDVHIILIRISGLWGSRFSCATKLESRWATHSIRSLTMFWETLKMIVLNGIFFIPKRKILVEFIPAGPDFPKLGSRLAINAYLEKFFNEKWEAWGEPLSKVPDYFWKKQEEEHEYLVYNFIYDLNLVSKPIRNAVIMILANKADIDCNQIAFDMHLARELGLDSMDIVEVLMELESQYKIPKLVPEDLTTVGHLIAIVGKIPIQKEVQKGEFHYGTFQ